MVILGIISVFICLSTWAMDYLDIVYKCPYCQIQRTIIGVLGICTLMPMFKSYMYIFLINILAFIDMITAVNQQFFGLKLILSSEIQAVIIQPIYENAFILSSFSLALITLLVIGINIRRFPRIKELLQD